jgi:hypothetical protein
VARRPFGLTPSGLRSAALYSAFAVHPDPLPIAQLLVNARWPLEQLTDHGGAGVPGSRK